MLPPAVESPGRGSLVDGAPETWVCPCACGIAQERTALWWAPRGLPPACCGEDMPAPVGRPSKDSPRKSTLETSWGGTGSFFGWILAGGVGTMTPGPGPLGHPSAPLEVHTFDWKGSRLTSR